MKYQRDMIYFGDIDQLMSDIHLNQYSSIFILCDENTVSACLPFFHQVFGQIEREVIVMGAGESNKNIGTCDHVWKSLLSAGADRHSLLINLGGGVVGDLGGFCASTYMRGIDFMQIPTTLLSQVDASVGGKTGVDFHHYKNLIGTFSQAKATYIDARFLTTLPPREMKNGLVETLKHALIADKELWVELANRQTPDNETLAFIKRSVGIKQNIVQQDPLESGCRKVLNFGHTIGHALEHLALSQKLDIRHGEAVAFGMMAATWLSVWNGALSTESALAIEQVILPYCTVTPTPEQCEEMLHLMKSDKKNKGQEVRFTLLNEIGSAVFDQIVNVSSVKKSILQCIDTVNRYQHPRVE
jgi:3-dehydroquinate synthase